MIPIRLRLGAISLQQLHPLAANGRIPNDKPGDVAAGVSEALHQSEADRIGDQGENDRNGARSLAQGLAGEQVDRSNHISITRSPAAACILARSPPPKR